MYADIPTLQEFKSLVQARADFCVSIYVPTTPQTQHIGAARIALGNLVKDAMKQIEKAPSEKKRRNAVAEHFTDLLEDEQFWKVQANSLAVLVTADTIRTYRLPNALQPVVEVSDRFHLKPLLRAITFPHHAFILALAENGSRLIESYADMPAVEIDVKDMPKDAGSATNRASVNDRSASGRIQGSEGQKVLLRQYARQIDAAIRPLLAGRHEPLILAAAEPLMSIFRSVCTYPGLVAMPIETSPGELTALQLADATRPILDIVYAGEVAAFHSLFEMRSSQGRATADISQAARAATFGAIETLLVDIDGVVHGNVDETTGAVVFSDDQGAASYGIIDEIAGRALISGANVMGVRSEDIPGGGALAAVLRYAF